MTVHNICCKPILSKVTNLHAILKPMGIYMIFTSLDFSPEIILSITPSSGSFSSPLLWNTAFLCFIFSSVHFAFLPLFSFLGPLTPAAVPLDVMPRIQSAPFSLHHYILSHWMISSTSMALKMMHIPTSPRVQPCLWSWFLIWPPNGDIIAFSV